METNARLLRDLPLLGKLGATDLQALASRAVVKRYRRGEAIVRQGDPGDSLHVVVEGVVRITSLSPSGEEFTFATMRPGESVGELSLLDGRARSANAIASEATRTLVIDRSDFLAWLLDHPAAAVTLLESLSLMVRRLSDTVTDLTSLDLAHRLAKLLLHLANGEGGESLSGQVRVRITQDELASMLGVSRQSVNKELNRLAGEGWLTLARGSVTLIDPDALRTFV
jgi:CRP-like cAMP-binding protein